MKNTVLHFQVDQQEINVIINHCYVIGYAGRDMEKNMAHIIELEKIGVPRPTEIPTLYPVRRSSLNQSGQIEVLGNESSGEVEVVIIFGDQEDDVYITVGSDHTDRSLETVDIGKSKQVCDKPLAQTAWKLSDVIDHWDELVLVSEVKVDGEWIAYQKDNLSSIIPYSEIIGFLDKKGLTKRNSAVFSGTVPLLTDFKYGTGFKMMIVDEVRNRRIEAEYEIVLLDK